MKNKKPKYNSLREWRKAEPSAYDAAKRKGLLIEICNRLGWEIKGEREKYSEAEILEVAERCKTFEIFTTKHKKAYKDACDLDIIEKVKEHINKLNLNGNQNKRKVLYTKEYVIDLAKKSLSFYAFRNEHKTANEVAIKNGWDKEIFEILDEKQWNEMRDTRALCAYTQTKEFLAAFDKFKETFVDIPYIKTVRY